MPNSNTVFPYPTTKKGQVIEEYAARYLETQGFELLYRNFRCKLGEIDLIGLFQTQLVFVEVRFRKNIYFGGAAASVDLPKQRKLIRTAQVFLSLHPQLKKLACRFDVIAATLHEAALKLDWIQNAFYAE